MGDRERGGNEEHVSREGIERGRMTLPRAVGISIGVHVLLLLLFQILPWPPPVESRIAPPSELTFRFDQPPPAVPPVPPQAATPPPQSQPPPQQPESEPVPPRSELFDQGPVPEATLSPKQSRAAKLGAPKQEPKPPPPEEAAEQEAPRPPQQAQVEKKETPPPDGIDVPGARSEYRPKSPETKPDRLDMGKALRDFREALARGAVQPKPPTEDSKQDPGAKKGLEFPDLPAVPVSGFGLDSDLYFQSRDYDWDDYARQIYTAIRRAWFNRLWLTTDSFDRWAFSRGSWMLDQQVVVGFTINRNGQITDIVVQVPSDCPPLDASAADALAAVVVPPLPSDFPRDSERVWFRFIATGDIRNMRSYFDYLKRAGAF